MTKPRNRYTQIIEKIFEGYYKDGATEIFFEREDIVRTASLLNIHLPKNLGDVIYSFRYRTNLPDLIRSHAPEGKDWVIRPVGQSRYKFALAAMARIVPSTLLAETKIPDATPGIIARYALNDEQGLPTDRYIYGRYVLFITKSSANDSQRYGAG